MVIRGGQFAWMNRSVVSKGLAGRGIVARPDVRATRLMSGFYRAAFEQTHEPLMAVASDGRVFDANAAACTFFERSHRQIVHGKIGDLIRPRTKTNGFSAESGVFPNVAHDETVFVRTDGTERPVEVTIRRDVVTDIHLVALRSRTEPQSMQAHLLRADRLSTFGMLAVGIAHEINNPLMYAMTNLRAVVRRMPEFASRARQHALDDLAGALEQGTRMLSMVDEGMDRIGALVRDLRISSHEGERRERLDVRSILESCLNIAHGEIKQRARIVRDYADVALVEGNSGRLGQVFLNLVVNAAQAIPEERASDPDTTGQIRVAARNLDDQRLAVEVSDNGLGISPDMIERIFEPFVTTKPAGEGTGLGLYIARSIVEELGGKLEVESALGVGTTMRVILPLQPKGPR